MALLNRKGAGPGGSDHKPDSRAVGFEDHPSRCIARCIFMDARDPSVKIEALFNPEEVRIPREAEWGDLHPIGWSSTTTQYAYTKSPDYSLTLIFSRVAMIELGVNYPAFHYARNFFNAFLHGDYPGRAPRFLMFVWPKTLMIVNAVKGVETAYRRWSQKGVLMEYAITLQLRELRQTWAGSLGAHLEGWDTLPDHSVYNISVARALLGKPTKMSGTPGKGVSAGG